ncbi:hypothetical protein [Bacillus mycoides]|uniref:hypothetical protein n=1 Tax=Bacillus mycoides TaxID=1405 RepID=UPI000815479F|nr:hypothetical protein [Bacillus mycoides]SCB99320.1 Uncharacterized protein BW664_01001 [Bacillus mycoides]
MKKSIVISLLAASALLLQGCNNTSSKASENKPSDAELQSVKKERDSLEKTNNELTKKIADLESKTNKEQKTYKLDEKLAKKIYSIYKGSPWNDDFYKGGWTFTKESDTKGIITADRGGGQPIYLLSNYAVIFETGLEDSMGQLKIIDLNTEKIIDQYPKQDNTASKESNKETVQKSSSKIDKEKLKKQLTDKTFVAPSFEEGGYKAKELDAAMEGYLISTKEKPEDYELEQLENPNNDGMSLFALRKDNHNGNMFVAGRYAVDKNGYVYEYDFFEQKAKDTPLTNLYIEELLNQKD